MSQRRELENHRQKLEEIREIMNSMKTLAYMETRKLTRFLDAQQAAAHAIEAAAADFVSYHPEVLPPAPETTPVYLLLGSERGFCGDFNKVLLTMAEACRDGNADNESVMITVGQKLNASLDDEARVGFRLQGASVVEEIGAVLARLVEVLAGLQQQHPALSLYVLYHGADDDGVRVDKLLPPFQQYLSQAPRYSHAPILNVPPADFLLQLTDHYLFATLYEILYTSLMAENRRRVEHLDGAVQHLDDKVAQLVSRGNALRQEEIIEEIEIILLSADSLEAARGRPAVGGRE